jgi:hypothetical protein
MMALPAEVLRPENRAAEMGLFYAFFYGGMSLLTTLAGFSRDFTGNSAAPLYFGGMLVAAGILILVLFRWYQRRTNLIPSPNNS